MSDIHALPLLGRDLPAAPQAPAKAKVFKDRDRWCYYHACGSSYRYWEWRDAYAGALRHTGVCR